MTYHILSSDLQLLETVATLIDAGEGYPKPPGGLTLHHALPETRHDGLEYALLADDVVASYLAILVASVAGEGADVEQVAADWIALKMEVIESASYTIDEGVFAGVVVRIGVKGAEWTPPESGMGEGE